MIEEENQTIEVELFPKNIIRVTSTAEDGNMSFLRGDHQKVVDNRSRFLAKYGIDPKDTVVMGAVHGVDISPVTKKLDAGKGSLIGEESIPVDGLVTNDKDLFLVLHTGDCLPITFYDPVNQAVGLIHSGWKGLDSRIPQRTIEVLTQNYGTNPKDLIIQIGPSIGPCHYGGPPNLRTTEDPLWQKFISSDVDNHHGLNLWGMAESQLQSSGVRPENIHNQKICTYESPNFYSHRKYEVEKLKDDYRFITVVGIRDLIAA